jgi:DNA-directed RNA polymerase specialized sigma24 family protein
MAQRPEQIASRFPRRLQPVPRKDQQMANPSRPPDPGRLAAALSRLSPIERDVLFLSASEGLLNDQIAARLKLSGEAVERHLADALVKLDRVLERRERPWWRFW